MINKTVVSGCAAQDAYLNGILPNFGIDTVGDVK